MSQLADLLAPRLPAGLVVPAPLERAWVWMEEQGWGFTNASGYYLTPYAGRRQLGVVFSSTETLEGWFAEGDAGFDRLLPVAEVSGDGSTGALWLDDGGVTRFVVLGSDGEVFLLAESADDLLRLLAIGYGELGVADFLTEPPDDEDPDEAESIEAHAALRAWVEDDLGLDVPDHWHQVEPDPFAAWVGARRS